MKIAFIFAILAGIASAAWWDAINTGKYGSAEEITPTHTKYASGKEYVYRYESQVLTGLPAFSKQYSGMKVKAAVRLSFTSDSAVLMQMEDPVVLSINQDVTDVQLLVPRMQLPIDLFNPLPSGQQSMINKKLVLPLKFSYKNGKVESIEIAQGETNWSLDIKRSILSMLQVKLQQEDNSKLVYNDLSEQNSTTFESLEESIDGICYSTMFVESDPENEKSYKVVKSRDGERCVLINQANKFSWQQRQCDCDCQNNTVGSDCTCAPTCKRGFPSDNIRIEYEVVSDDLKAVLIKSAIQTVEIRRILPTDEMHFISIFSNQTLSLVEERSAITTPKTQYKYRKAAKPWSSKVINFEDEDFAMTPEQRVEAAKDALEKLDIISQNAAQFDDHIPVFFYLAEILQHCKAEQFVQLFNEFKSTSENYQRKWKLLLDALTYINSTQAETFLLEKIQSGEIQTQHAIGILIQWTADKVPTALLLDKLMETVQSLSETTQREISEQMTLCFGSLLQRYIQAQGYLKLRAPLQQDKDIAESLINLARKYEKFIEGKLGSATTQEGKIFYLRVIRNAGSIRSLPIIQQYLATTENDEVRFYAAAAFKDMCVRNRQKCIQSLLPLFSNRNESDEIRFTALQIIMNTNPSIATFELVRQHIDSEINLDLKTLFVSYLKSLIDTEDTCTHEMSAKVKDILQRIRPFRESSNNWVNQFRVGSESQFELVRLQKKSDRENFTFVYEHLFSTLNISQSSFEIAFQATGFNQIIDKLYNKQPAEKKDRHSAWSDFEQNPSTTQKSQKTSPLLVLSARFMGRDIVSIRLDEQAINQMILKGMRNAQLEFPFKLFHTLMLTPQITSSLKPFGHWVVADHLQAAIIDIDGKVKVNLQGGKPVASFEFNKPVRFDRVHKFGVRVNAGPIFFGLYTQADSHIYVNSDKLTMTANLANGTVNITCENPAEGFLQVKKHAETATFFVAPAVNNDAVPTKSAISKVMECEHDSQSTVFTYSISHLKSIGIDAEVDVDINEPLHKVIVDYTHLLPVALTLKKQRIDLNASPASNAQRVLQLVFGVRDFEHEDLYSMDSSVQQQREQKRPKKAGLTGVFNSIFGGEDSSEEDGSSTSISDDVDEDFGPLNLGSARYQWFMILTTKRYNSESSIYCNLTAQYEHEYPYSKYLLTVVRPPIPSVEKGKWQLKAEINKAINPSTNEVIVSQNWTWGEAKSYQQKTVQVIVHRSPLFRNSECLESSVYGCKDAHGVFYPVWSNTTHVIKSQYPKVMQTISEAIELVLGEGGNRIISVPNEETFANRLTFTVVHKDDQMADVLIKNSTLVSRHENVHVHLESKVDEFFFRNWYQVGEVRRGAQFIPIHQDLHPFDNEEVCLVDAVNTYTFDKKQLVMPQTNCEVVLVRDCGESQKVLVTMKTETNGQKNLKIVIRKTKIEFNMQPATTFSSDSQTIKVNDEIRDLDTDKQMIVNEDGQAAAVVTCTDDKCELRSSTYGVYVSIDSRTVMVKVMNQVHSGCTYCGVCARRESSTDVISGPISTTIVRENRYPGEQCTVAESSANASRSTRGRGCQTLKKNKLIHTIMDGVMMTCITKDPLPMCTKSCTEKKDPVRYVPAHCVAYDEVQRMEVNPRMEGEDIYVDDPSTLRKLRFAQTKQVLARVAYSCQ